MKKYVFVMLMFFVVTCTFVVSSCVTRKAEPLSQETFNPVDKRVINGEKVFMMYCHKCHPGGEGGLGPSIITNPAPQFIKRFQMRHGLGVMPSFKKNEISKQDLHDISKYLRAWKKH